MADHYDVIVAGGGPAGLSAARAAAAEGGKVLLLEMQAQIGGQTQSASWVPRDLIEKDLERSIASDVSGVKLHSPHLELEVQGDFGAVVDRRMFDKLLAVRTADAGAEIWVSCPVKDLLKKDGRVNGVLTEAGSWSERLECELVIDATGAGGSWSSLFLRKVLGKDWDEEQLALSNEYLMANANVGKSVELFFTSYFAPLGCAWVFPFWEKFAMIGVRGVRIHPDAALDEFMGQAKLPGLEGAAPVAAFRGQLPIEEGPKQACSDGIMAVGEAAGQIYPLSGQGTKYALRCGELAGKVAIDAITEGNVSGDALAEYDRKWRAEFERELQVGRLLHTGLRASPDQKTDDLLKAMESDAQLQRDFVSVFLPLELGERLKGFLSNDGVQRIFGKKSAENALSLYS